LREEKFMTQAELAKAAKVGVLTVSRMERKTHHAQFQTVRKVAAALGVDPSTLDVLVAAAA
jgi:transcriptional regulator with XRE-family HTH domain